MYAMSVDGLLPKVNLENTSCKINIILSVNFLVDLSVFLNEFYFEIHLVCFNLGVRRNGFSRQFDEKYNNQWCPMHIDINIC